MTENENDRQFHRSILAATGLVAVCFVVLTALTVSFVYWQVASSQHKWCDTISLLTSIPVPSPSDPSSNPSRVADYRLYQDFVTLKGRLGCG
jgi:hypothetical protein